MTKNLNIYVATMTGTALMVADEIEDFCKTEGINTNIVEMDALEPKNLEDLNAPILIVSSTYGKSFGNIVLKYILPKVVLTNSSPVNGFSPIRSSNLLFRIL